MPYIAGPQPFGMLTNALSGVAAGTKDFAQLKVKRDSLRQDQAQHGDKMAMALHQLDTQISEANLDRTQRAELEHARNELNAKLTREGYVSAERRARISIQPGMARVAERRRQFNYLKTQAAQQDNAINEYVNTLPPLPTVTQVTPLRAGASPEDVAEFERLTGEAGLQQQDRASAIAQQTDWLAVQLAGPGGGAITPQLRKRAAAIIADKSGFSTRVYTRAQNIALAKRGQFAGGPWEGATQTSKGYQTPYGLVETAGGSFPKFEVPYMHTQFGRSAGGEVLVTKDEMEAVYADTKSMAGQQKIKQFRDLDVRLATLERIDESALARQFGVALMGMDSQRASYARLVMDDWTDQWKVYQDRPHNQEVTVKEAAAFQKLSQHLDYAMGNQNGQMQNAASVAMQYARNQQTAMLPSGESIADWTAGTARSTESLGGRGLSPADLMKQALEAQPTRTQLSQDYDYEDQLIDQWDAVIGGGGFDLRARHKPETLPQMIGFEEKGFVLTQDNLDLLRRRDPFAKPEGQE